MRNITVGIIDYGIGNHASIAHSLRDMGFRVRVSKDPVQLDSVDALVLPGVGAFPAAMKALYKRDLVEYIQKQAELNRPLIGICLGMQLLTSASFEHEYTAGLDLIPGEVIPFEGHGVHIGWNTLECSQHDPLLSLSDGQSFYFNHSFYYQGPTKYQVASTRNSSVFIAAIRCNNTVGLQFHPEKSQSSGKKLLSNLILELVDA